MNAETDQTRTHEALIAGLIALALFALSLGLRLPDLDRFVTPDELKWVCRSTNFYRGLRGGQLQETMQTGHPGVLTMWLGTPFAGHDPSDPKWEITREVSLADLIAENPPGTAAELAALLFRARRGVALVTSLAIGLAFLLLWRLTDLESAGLAGLLLAVDPFLLAHSRFLHLDALTTSLLLLSILSLILALERENRWLVAMSGVLGALAALNKSPALFIGPFAGLLILGYTIWRRDSWRVLVVTAMVWGLPLLVTYAAVWPVMWVDPLIAIRLVLGTAFGYASNPHTNSNFFLGRPRPDPGPLFYPVALVFRLTPWVTLGAILAVPWLWARERRGRLLRLLALFVIGFGLFMTLGQKKFDRYLLPVFPFCDIIAALGLVWSGRWLLHRLRRERLERWLAPGMALITVGLAAWLVWPHRPYYLTYYNPVVGGGQAAVETLLVGWGEGLDEAARYLDGLPDAETSVMSARSLPGSASFFRGIAVDEEHYDAATTDYVVTYLNEVQRRLGLETLARYYDVAEPLHVVQMQGIDYAWVYENKTHEPVAGAIAGQADVAGDAIVVSRPSRFEEQYDGPLEVLVIDPDASREQRLADLQTLADGHERLWYVRYNERNPNPELDWLDHVWRTRAYAQGSQEFTDVTLSLWRVADAPGFAAQSTEPMPQNLLYGDALRLQSVRLDTAAAQYGRALGIELAWEAQSDLEQYYAEYVHLLDALGRRWGQGDRWMTDETLSPTVTWQQGQHVSDLLALELLPGIPPGEYRLVLGVYDRVSGERLTAVGGDGEALGEQPEIARITVAPSPIRLSESDLSIPQRLDLSVVPGLTLLGWHVQPERPAFGQTAAVLLYWRADAVISGDWTAEVALRSAESTFWAEGSAVVGGESYPTSRWQAGDIFWQVVDITLSEQVPAGDLDLVLSLTSAGAKVRAELGTVSVDGHHWSRPDIPHAQQAALDGAIRLLGYELAPPVVNPGETVHLTLYWELVAEAHRNLTVFTHLLDAGGAVRGQRDSVPMKGRYPVTTWQQGETIVDRYAIPVDDDAPAGLYQIEIGMYDPADGAKRVPLLDAEGARQQDDRLLLDSEIEIRQ